VIRLAPSEEETENDARISGTTEVHPWLEPSVFEIPVEDGDIGAETAFPVIQLRDAVITVGQPETFPVRDGCLEWTGQEGLLLASLLDRRGRWVTNGLLRGFAQKLDALAVSFGISGDILVLGCNPSAMTDAVRRLLQMGGGAVLMDGGREPLEIRLPVLQVMSAEPYESIAQQAIELDRRLREAGYAHLDPIYTLMFIPATHLPYLRLTSQGIYSVMERRVLHPVRMLRQQTE